MLTNPKDPRIRAVRQLLRSGAISITEAAGLAGCTRQHMYRLVDGMKLEGRREAYLKKIWAETLNQQEG